MIKMFECPKCNSNDVFIEKNGNNTGLYCKKCGKWIKWLNKDEIRLVEEQIKEHSKTTQYTSLLSMMQDILEKCAADICDNYCKYPPQYKEEEWDKLMNENKLPCNDCPLMNLI